MNDLILNLIIYTDGVQVTKSPSTSIWPVVCGLIEFPPILRNSNINKIICGVWYGINKPTSDILFENVLDQIKELSLNGIEFTKDNINRKIYLKLYGFIYDIPAKCMAMKMICFNGYFSCPYCLIEGSFKNKNKFM